MARMQQDRLETLRKGASSIRKEVAELARDATSDVADLRQATERLCDALEGLYWHVGDPGWKGFSLFRLTGRLLRERDSTSAAMFEDISAHCRACVIEAMDLKDMLPRLAAEMDVTHATALAETYGDALKAAEDRVEGLLAERHERGMRAVAGSSTLRQAIRDRIAEARFDSERRKARARVDDLLCLSEPADLRGILASFIARLSEESSEVVDGSGKVLSAAKAEYAVAGNAPAARREAEAALPEPQPMAV